MIGYASSDSDTDDDNTSDHGGSLYVRRTRPESSRTHARAHVPPRGRELVGTRPGPFHFYDWNSLTTFLETEILSEPERSYAARMQIFDFDGDGMPTVPLTDEFDVRGVRHVRALTLIHPSAQQVIDRVTNETRRVVVYVLSDIEIMRPRRPGRSLVQSRQFQRPPSSGGSGYGGGYGSVPVM